MYHLLQQFWSPGETEFTIYYRYIANRCQIYGLSEVIGGSLKIIGICVVIGSMIAINVGGKSYHISQETLFDLS